jgi:hypothetical protein
MGREWYFALLRPNIADGGWGCFDRTTGACLFYSEGNGLNVERGEWFFEMGTARPAFYLKDGVLNWVPGPTLDVVGRSRP